MTIIEKPQYTVNPEELERKVKAMYRMVALHPEVQYYFEMGRDLAERVGYDPARLDQIPAPAIDSFAGVGHHFDLAELKPGEVVVDLGSGSGIDVFYASRQVGPAGEVFGIDMTDEQLYKANSLRKAHDFKRVWFLNSYIEELPILAQCVDVVMSNGVINLSAGKEKVFREAARVLKKGGRLVVSDIVSTLQLPPSIKNNATLWAACIGGAMQFNAYTQLIEESGFELQHIRENNYDFLSKGARQATLDYGIKSISLLAIKK